MLDYPQRKGLIIYLYYNRDARKLAKFGDILYHSRRLRYLVIYMEASLIETAVEELKKLKFVKKVKVSYLPDIDQRFVGSLQQ